MFRLIRFFFVTSAIAIAAITAAVIYYRQHEINQLVAFAESQNVALAQAFANTIWPRFATFVMSAPKFRKETLAVRPEIRQIREAVKLVTAGLPMLKVKIYSLNGLTVYSSNAKEIGESKASNPGFITAARDGQPASKLTFRDAISSFEGTVQDRDLVESYLPVRRRGDGPVVAVFELYTDVTPLLAGIRRATVDIVIGFVVMFGLLFVMLFVVVLRADRTIKGQYADITDKKDALEREVAEREVVENSLKLAQDELELRVDERTRELTDEIAERKRAENEARRHRQELTQVGAVVIMGEMATTLAHELNQPLTVISGSAQLCLKRLHSDNMRPHDLVDGVEQIAKQAERANEIIRRVRNFVNKDERERTLIDVNETIFDIADMLESDAREHDVAIELQLAECLPSVVADKIQIQQVMLNIVHNGIEAAGENHSNSAHLTIRTGADDSDSIEIAIHDNGDGITANDLGRIFDPFFTTKINGLGMGLSISRSIIESHGGRLWATSDRKSGTVFHFTLPVAEEAGSNGV